MAPIFMSAVLRKDEPTWRCHQNPFIGALGIQEPVIPGEPLIKGKPMTPGTQTGSYDPKSSPFLRLQQPLEDRPLKRKGKAVCRKAVDNLERDRSWDRQESSLLCSAFNEREGREDRSETR